MGGNLANMFSNVGLQKHFLKTENWVGSFAGRIKCFSTNCVMMFKNVVLNAMARTFSTSKKIAPAKRYNNLAPGI